MILVTGATGFVGRPLVARLLAEGADLVILGRSTATSSTGITGANPAKAGTRTIFADLNRPETIAAADLPALDAVIHAAARVHQMNDRSADPLAEFRRINVEASCALAEKAHAAGAKRFVFISSIKVNGEGTEPGRAYGADDVPHPEDPYGLSKKEAEDALFEIGRRTGMEIVVIRPVLVYGPEPKGNFAGMIKVLAKGLPLPLGLIDNRRSLVSVDNLVDLIVTALRHPAAANQIFLVSDGEDLSTPDLLRRTARAMGRQARLLPVPVGLIRFAARLIGRPGIATRLTGSLQVDISKTRTRLGWTPPVSVDEGLARIFRQG